MSPSRLNVDSRALVHGEALKWISGFGGFSAERAAVSEENGSGDDDGVLPLPVLIVLLIKV